MEPGRQGRRAVLLPRRQGALQRDAATRPPAEDVDDEYPIILTTGRVVSQFLSGTQTRRIGPLVDQCPEPRIEMHPQLARELGIADGDWVTVETRRGNCTLRAPVVTTIRPDTVFIPYHWAGPQERQPADDRRAGPDLEDPRVQGVRGAGAQGGGAAGVRRCPRAATVGQVANACLFQTRWSSSSTRAAASAARRASRPARECDTHKGHSMIHLDYVDRAHSTQTVPVVCMHCDSPTCAEVCPADAIKRTEDGVVQTRAQAALHRLQQLRARLPVRRARR